MAEAHNNLGVALALSGDPSAAEAALRRAQALEPGGSEAADNLQALARAKVQGIIDPGYRLAPAADLRPQGVPAGALCPNHTNKPRLSAIPGARPSWTEPAG